MELEGIVRGKVADAIDDLDLNRKFAGLEDALGEALNAVQILGSVDAIIIRYREDQEEVPTDFEKLHKRIQEQTEIS